MAIFNLNINGKTREVDVDPNTPMLWVLRENLNLVGTKYGCGISQCGSCTIHLDGVAVRACMVTVSMVGNNLELDQGVGVCGKEGQSVPVGVGQPTLKLDELTVGGTQS